MVSESSISPKLAGLQWTNGKRVERVTKFGEKRTVHFKDGTKQTGTKPDVLTGANQAFRQDALRKAKASIRKVEGGVAITIGGKLNGTRKTYTSKGRAEAAARRILGL